MVHIDVAALDAAVAAGKKDPIRDELEKIGEQLEKSPAPFPVKRPTSYGPGEKGPIGEMNARARGQRGLSCRWLGAGVRDKRAVAAAVESRSGAGGPRMQRFGLVGGPRARKGTSFDLSAVAGAPHSAAVCSIAGSVGVEEHRGRGATGARRRRLVVETVVIEDPLDAGGVPDRRDDPKPPVGACRTREGIDVIHLVQQDRPGGAARGGGHDDGVGGTVREECRA